MPNTDILNKTWTLPGSEEKLAEETFNDLPASYENNNITQIKNPTTKHRQTKKSKTKAPKIQNSSMFKHQTETNT